MAIRTLDTSGGSDVDAWSSDDGHTDDWGAEGATPDLTDSERDEGADLTEFLSNAHAAKANKGKAKATPQDSYNDKDEDDLSGDEAFIRASLAKANLKAGSQALKTMKAFKTSKAPGGSGAVTGGGSFQSLGLHPALLRALLLRGFTTPTPIQRAALPHILASPPRDVVGMARTGSGKTLAYMVPLIQRLGGRHSAKFGARALVMVPTRELAVQVLKVGKDLAKGFTQGGGTKGAAGGDGESGGKGEGLRWGLVVGGDALEEQFSMVASNPDVIIATPGRLLHLAVEMNLSLASVSYLVFDEADRLFELGFATHLSEILARLPPSRQTLLFSATLPKSLVEFTKAGLQNPKLVRLDSESKVSKDLQMSFLSVKPSEKEAALLVLLSDVIGVPKLGDGTAIELEEPDRSASSHAGSKKRKRTNEKTGGRAHRDMAAHQTIIFAATKHHVEYLSGLLTAAGYTCSHIYSSLDHSARLASLAAFRAGRASLLIVTDLAARGLDIPVLENVVNYDFPTGSRAFVHRVGRTARAGRKGWAYSLLSGQKELGRLVELSMFMSRPLVTCPLPASSGEGPDFIGQLVLGTVPRDRLDAELEYVRETLVAPSVSLSAMVAVVDRAQRLYERSLGKAGGESFRRAKEMMNKDAGLAGAAGEAASVNPIFGMPVASSRGAVAASKQGSTREGLLALVNGFRPQETVFEVGTRGKTPAAQLMRERRKKLGKIIDKKRKAASEVNRDTNGESGTAQEADAGSGKVVEGVEIEGVNESEIEDVFEIPKKRRKSSNGSGFRDPNFYLGYEQADAATERGYSLNDGASSFQTQANAAAFDLGATDEAGYSGGAQLSRPSQTRWDRKQKKFVRTGQEGADNKKLIKTESGNKLPASFRKGVYEDWKAKERVKMPRVGEEEIKGRRPHEARRYRHRAGVSGDAEATQGGGRGKGAGAKAFGKTPDGKKRFLGPTHQVTRGGDGGKARPAGAGAKGKKKTRSRPGQVHRNGGLKTVDQMRKERDMKERRVKRSNQPSRRKK